MSKPVIPRPRAELDIDDFFFFLALDAGSPQTAERFLDALERAYHRLSENPEIGAPQQFANPRLTGLRMWPVPGFDDRLIYYFAREGVIDVVRILGGPEDRAIILNKEDEE